MRERVMFCEGALLVSDMQTAFNNMQSLVRK